MLKQASENRSTEGKREYMKRNSSYFRTFVRMAGANLLVFGGYFSTNLLNYPLRYVESGGLPGFAPPFPETLERGYTLFAFVSAVVWADGVALWDRNRLMSPLGYTFIVVGGLSTFTLSVGLASVTSREWTRALASPYWGDAKPYFIASCIAAPVLLVLGIKLVVLQRKRDIQAKGSRRELR